MDVAAKVLLAAHEVEAVQGPCARERHVNLAVLEDPLHTDLHGAQGHALGLVDAHRPRKLQGQLGPHPECPGTALGLERLPTDCHLDASFLEVDDGQAEAPGTCEGHDLPLSAVHEPTPRAHSAREHHQGPHAQLHVASRARELVEFSRVAFVDSLEADELPRQSRQCKRVHGLDLEAQGHQPGHVVACAARAGNQPRGQHPD
mmetsp:Transcript_33371/g.99401  ORF Transcript_33371/g.99401 Transcript_33371/m.99401 type:complete len:203 (+) Transcript_33371:233-841(+)